METESANGLPPNVDRVLTEFVAAASNSFTDDLRSVVLFGSGAEGKLRRTSDVNLLLVLSQFDQAKADRLRDPLRTAEASVRLRAMFLLESELRPALKAFAVKFGDILRRRRVLYGDDPFAGLSVSREDSIFRLKQTLLNLTLRMREMYVARGYREEQLAAVIADMAGPLRSCAATLLELEGKPAQSPKEALNLVANSLPNLAISTEELSRISEARERKTLEPGTAAITFFHLIDLAHSMWTRALTLS
jgi:predicted nucleotidyltransferase